ncbi:hypothetical protein DUNSADRAFT_8008 [Dunaliella salina]|uniref:Uncharacterized protein n=1 Tax=Dunaliella salina TaxID=3046 RepID=A0ABQ7FT22_DUNSA|nr:hypothetical protein DUNSADRAFT_8008 [Dunaliella salina]|eukprot:KAF5825630.1 hypothetical protein DUNSADRAFT_8008 [Dunaliella salina]
MPWNCMPPRRSSRVSGGPLRNLALKSRKLASSWLSCPTRWKRSSSHWSSWLKPRPLRSWRPTMPSRPHKKHWPSPTRSSRPSRWAACV